MDKTFQSALTRLTAWYLLIIMIICLGFSAIVYEVSSLQFDRPLPPRSTAYQQSIDPDQLEQIRASRADEARSSLLGSLAVVNAAALVLGGVGSYLLARRTLRPIQQAAEARERFISDASHELRTPLAVMQSEIEISLRDSKTSRPALLELARSNLEEVNRLRELSDRLLQLSAGTKPPIGPIQLEDALLDRVAGHLITADKKNITITNAITPVLAIGNAENLADAVSILIDNAIKYSTDGSEITVSTFKRNKNVYIQVVDHGRGISASDLSRIFDRFFRADAARSSTDVKGHGLGLSIADQIVKSMNGTISVESKEGLGSTFTIRLEAANNEKTA